MILLTKEEVLEVWDKAGDGFTWGDYASALNKAQLKKVAEWLENEHPFTKRSSGNQNWYEIDIDVWEWQELLKEIE